MKKLLTALLFLNGSFIFAQKAVNKEYFQIIENMFQEVFSNLDSTRLENYVTPDFILFEDGQVYNNDSVRIIIKNLIIQFKSEENKDKKFERINSFEFLGSHSDENSGWIYYRNFADFKMDGVSIAKLHWLESANFIQTNQGWRISFLHSTIAKESIIQNTHNQ